MLVLLRIISTAALLYCINQARLNSQTAGVAGDLSNAFWLGGGVIIALVCAATWAPLIGERVADPLTGGLVNSPFEEPKNRLLRLIRWCAKKGYRRAVVFLCFFEGIRAPWLPVGFILGMKAAREGSWIQKVYAREVWKFNNVENCLLAHRILLSHGIYPGSHPNTKVNTILMTQAQEPKPTPQPMQLKETAAISKPSRDKRIRIGGEE